MLTYVRFTFLFALAIAAARGADADSAELSLSLSAPALRCEGQATVEQTRHTLFGRFIGITRAEARVALNTIIQQRGSLGSVKNSKNTSLSLSSRDSSFHVQLIYGPNDRVVDVKCSLKKRRRLGMP